MLGPACSADAVDACEQATDAFQLLVVELVGRASTDLRKHRKIDALVRQPMQRLAVDQGARGDGRNFVACEIFEEAVLLEDLRLAPAARTVELRDQEAVGRILGLLVELD